MHHKRFEGLDHASIYKLSRPVPPKSLIQSIIEYMKEQNKIGANGKFGKALDMGCGSGQCTEALADYFDQVVGYDVSDAQINEAKNANRLSNVSYKLASAENTLQNDSSVDLITCCSSFHWFNRDKFLDEVRRILKPNGVLALIGHCFFTAIFEDEQIRELYAKNIEIIQTAGYSKAEYFDIIRGCFKDLEVPLNDVKRVQNHLSRTLITGKQLIGFQMSMSTYQEMKICEPDKAKIWETNFEEDLIRILGSNALQEPSISITWEYYCFMARK